MEGFRKIFRDEMINNGFQFEVEGNHLFIRNMATDDYFIIDDKERALLKEAIEYLESAETTGGKRK